MACHMTWQKAWQKAKQIAWEIAYQKQVKSASMPITAISTN